MASGAAFLGWTLGDELDLGAGDFVAIEPGVYRFVDAVRVGEQTAERVLFHAPGGRLDQVELVFAAEGEAAARALAEWVDAACAPFTDQVERFMPSPLGTPPPGGGEWDPVHTSKATCAGAIAGVRIAVREQQTWTKETHSSDVRVTLRAQTDE